MWYQVVVILGLMMAHTVAADQREMVDQQRIDNEELRIITEECQDEEFIDTEEGKKLCTALADDQQLRDVEKELLLVLKELCNKNAFIATHYGKEICTAAGAFPTTPSSSTTSSTTETVPNNPMITTGDTGAPNSTSPNAASEATPDSTEGHSSAITWTCIGVVLAVIVLVAVGVFIHRYTKRAGSHHSFQIRYRKMSPEP